MEELYLNEDGMLPKFDVGEVEIVGSNLEETFGNIVEKAKQGFKETDKVVFLGGDHSISYSCVKAVGEGKKIGLVVLMLILI